MKDVSFDKPVRAALGRSGNVTHTVTSTVRAAEILLYEWPADPGRKHLAARKACMKVLDGLAEAKHAREALEAAAQEADILRDPPPRSIVASEGPTLWRGRKRKLKRDM